MTRPESLFEAASYDLNKFRERRMADRRFMVRDTPDRRKMPDTEGASQPSDNADSAAEGQSKSPGADSQS